MDSLKDNEFYIGKTKYSIKFDYDNYRRINNKDCYGKDITISKDNVYWSAINIGITGQVVALWKQDSKQFDINEFISQIAPFFIKVGIYNNEIDKISDDLKIKEFVFVSNEAVNPNQKRILKTPLETIEYYRKKAEEINKPRIGF